MIVNNPLRFARIVALGVPVGALGGALAFQFLGGLTPCEMCWWQRYAHIAALVLALAALPMRRPHAPLILSGLALVGAGLLGGYHAGIEYGWWKGVTACTSDIRFTPGADPLEAIMRAPLVRCDEVQWSLLGISLAGYNFLLSTAAGILVLWLATRKEGDPA